MIDVKQLWIEKNFLKIKQLLMVDNSEEFIDSVVKLMSELGICTILNCTIDGDINIYDAERFKTIHVENCTVNGYVKDPLNSVPVFTDFSLGKGCKIAYTPDED